MSALLSTPRATDRDASEAARPPRWSPESGPTLDDVVSRTWEVLRAGAPATCMVCGGELAPRESAGSAAAGGRCDSCGTALG